MINKSLIFTVKQKIFAFFCLHPDHKFHEREVARRVKISPAAGHGAIKSLAEENILQAERKGKMVFHNLNESRPLVRQYKTMVLVFALEPLILKLAKITDRVILYGSSASGEYLTASDVDLLIVTSHPEKAQKVLFNFGKSFTKEIKPVITSLAEWMVTEEKDPVFFSEVNKGLVLYQSEHYESEI